MSPSNTQQGVKTDATYNIQQCWELLVYNGGPFAGALDFHQLARQEWHEKVCRNVTLVDGED